MSAQICGIIPIDTCDNMRTSSKSVCKYSVAHGNHGTVVGLGLEC
jgi:hypothetical protein